MFTTLDATPRRCKGRGKAKGYELVAKVNKDGKIALKFDESGGIWKALREYGPWLDSLINIHSKDICEPYHNAWKDVVAEHKKKIQYRMLVIANIYSYKIFFKLNIIKPLTI